MSNVREKEAGQANLAQGVERRNSLRWRLPLSYAAIAGLTAVVLGTVMLGALLAVYEARERAYLEQSAHLLRPEVAEALASGEAETVIAERALWAALNELRIQVLDPEGAVLADSGPAEPFLSTRLFIPDPPVPPLPPAPPGEQRRPVPDLGELYGLEPRLFDGGLLQHRPLRASLSTPPERQVVLPIAVPDGSVTGYLLLEGGPDDSRAIVAGVAVVWALAAAVAITIAALAGWMVSRRLNAPLLALTDAAGRMGAGELATRVAIGRSDEIGLLSRAFNRMAGQVEQTVETLRRFVADAAHELNTPLAALQNSLELAQNETDPAEQRLLLQHARQQTVRLQALAAGLLDLSRLEAGGQTASATSADLVHIVLKAAEIYASRAEQKGIAFTLDVPDSPAWIGGVADELTRAVNNLLDNAVKFTPSGGRIYVRVTVEAVNAILTVEDTGIGIPDADLPYLFRRFHRGRNAAAYPGSGLGLALVQAIVERYGGSVAAENTKRGARFVLHLPLTPGL